MFGGRKFVLAQDALALCVGAPARPTQDVHQLSDCNQGKLSEGPWRGQLLQHFQSAGHCMAEADL